MEILNIKEFLTREGQQFEWMYEFGIGEAITRLKDNKDFYLNDWNHISVPTISSKGEFDFDVFEYSITKMYHDKIHVDIAINSESFYMEINDLEKAIDAMLNKLSAAQKELLEEHRLKNKPLYDINSILLTGNGR